MPLGRRQALAAQRKPRRCMDRSHRRGALLLAASFCFGAAAADFEVSAGYLSTNAETLATGYGWSLVWEAGEDRLIEHPFAIANDSLSGAFEGLLGAYRGQFVADLYRSNKVVVVSIPLPQVEVALPGAVAGEADMAPDSITEHDASARGAGSGPLAIAAVASAEGELLDRAGVIEPAYEAAGSGQDVAAGSAVAQ